MLKKWLGIEETVKVFGKQLNFSQRIKKKMFKNSDRIHKNTMSQMGLGDYEWVRSRVITHNALYS